MKAIILCAGKGERLRPFTYHTPKPLLKINGIPILEHIFQSLYIEDKIPIFTDVYVIVDYLKDKIINYCNTAQKRHMFSIHTINQCNMNGTSGGIYSVKSQIDEPFVVLNGDTIFETEDIIAVANSEALNAVGIEMVSDAYNYGVPCICHNSISHIIEKPKGINNAFISAGIYKFDNSIFRYIPLTPARNGEYVEVDAINLSIDSGNVFVPVYLKHKHLHISTIDDYKRHR